jgi:hypothetical protein
MNNERNKEAAERPSERNLTSACLCWNRKSGFGSLTRDRKSRYLPEPNTNSHLGSWLSPYPASLEHVGVAFSSILSFLSLCPSNLVSQKAQRAGAFSMGFFFSSFWKLQMGDWCNNITKIQWLHHNKEWILNLSFSWLYVWFN